MPGDAIQLIHRLQRSDDAGKIDFKNDWKLATLFVGGNDMCDYCKEKVRRSIVFWICRLQISKFSDELRRCCQDVKKGGGDVSQVAIQWTIQYSCVVSKNLHMLNPLRRWFRTNS